MKYQISLKLFFIFFLTGYVTLGKAQFAKKFAEVSKPKVSKRTPSEFTPVCERSSWMKQYIVELVHVKQYLKTVKRKGVEDGPDADHKEWKRVRGMSLSQAYQTLTEEGKLNEAGISYTCDDITKEVFQNTVGSLLELRFSNKRIFRIAHGDFSGFAQVRKLDLSYNRLQTLEPQVLFDIFDLKTLWLMDNPFVEDRKYGLHIKEKIKKWYKTHTGRNIFIQFRYKRDCGLLELDKHKCIETPDRARLL